MASKELFGRKVIKTTETVVTKDNVVNIVKKAMEVHEVNRADINYLWNYYKGDQPILKRIKKIRPEINNKIVDNIANEFVSFRLGYTCGEPIQYVSRGSDNITDKILTLNDLMYVNNKAAKDRKLVEWLLICGTGYRLLLPNKDKTELSPFKLHTLDPLSSFVVYSYDLEETPLLGVYYYVDEENTYHYSVYTSTTFYSIKGEEVVDEKAHVLGQVPLIEYPANNARLGCFEIVLPLLDAINTLESNRMDGIEQFVQAYWKFLNCKIDKEKYNEFLKEGTIVVPPAEGITGTPIVDLITQELNQEQTQIEKNNLYNSARFRCGIPSQGSGESVNANNGAAIIHDGWSQAEAKAKDLESMFKEAEIKMLNLLLKIVSTERELDLNLYNIDIKFTRRNYEAIQSKAQVLATMLGLDKVDPLDAFIGCGMFSDPEEAYKRGMAFYEENKGKVTPPENNVGDDNKAQVTEKL